MVGSARYDIQKYEVLINNYLDNGSTDLADCVLTGDELLDLVEALSGTIDYQKKYNEVKELSQNLIKDVERIFKRKKGQIADELKILLENAKESLEKDK